MAKRETAASRFIRMMFTVVIMCAVVGGGYLLYQRSKQPQKPNKMHIARISADQSYRDLCKEITDSRDGFRSMVAQARGQEEATRLNLRASGYVCNALANKVLPRWISTTPVTEKGNASRPGNRPTSPRGLVIGALMDVGFNLKYKNWAYCSPRRIISAFFSSRSIYRSYRKGGVRAIENKLNQSGPGLYIISVDGNHIGFVLAKKNSAFFIHAEPNKFVTRENVRDSRQLQNCKSFVLGKISGDRLILKDWLQGRRVKAPALR